MIHELACIGTRKVELLRLALEDRLRFYDAAVAFGPIETAARLLAIEEAEVQRVRASGGDSRNVWAVPDAVASYDNLLLCLVTQLACGELVAEAIDILANGEPAEPLERRPVYRRDLYDDEVVKSFPNSLLFDLVAQGEPGGSPRNPDSQVGYMEIAAPPKWRPVESAAWVSAEWHRSASPANFESPISVLLGDEPRRLVIYVQVRVPIGIDGPAVWTKMDDALPQLVPPALWHVLADMRQAFENAGGPKTLLEIARSEEQYADCMPALMPQQRDLVELHDSIRRLESLLWDTMHGMLRAGTVRARTPVEHGSGAWQEWQPEKWLLYRIEVAGERYKPSRIEIVLSVPQPDGTLRRLPAHYFQFLGAAERQTVPNEGVLGHLDGITGQPTDNKKLKRQSSYRANDLVVLDEVRTAYKTGKYNAFSAICLFEKRLDGNKSQHDAHIKRLYKIWKETYPEDFSTQNGSDLSRLSRSERT